MAAMGFQRSNRGFDEVGEGVFGVLIGHIGEIELLIL